MVYMAKRDYYEILGVSKNASDDEIKKIDELAQTDEISEIFKHHDDLVKNNIHAKGIPTMIYEGRKHTGKYEVK